MHDAFDSESIQPSPFIYGEVFEYDKEATVHGLIQQQAERTPDAIACIHGEEQLTYGQLDERAQSIAHQLTSNGVGSGDLVAIFIDKSIDMIVGLLGILKSGAAYVPIAPDCPPERIATILSECEAKLTLTHSDRTSSLPAQTERLCLDKLQPLPGADLKRRDNEGSGEDIMYVIFTSGSTGKPKGVILRHKGILSLMLWAKETFGLSQGDRVLQNAVISFDLSVMEIFWPLLSGAVLVMPPKGWIQNAEQIASLIETQQLTHLFIVPSVLSLVLDEAKPNGMENLKAVHSGGEALPEKLRDRFLSHTKTPLYNWYGPTEASIFTTLSPCTSSKDKVVLGYPVPNARVCVLDEALTPVSEGETGILYIGGDCLAKGYFKLPDLTSKVFIPDPFSTRANERLYRTGDRVRLLQNGHLEFLGREDHQIKLRGYRIELGEIEAALLEHPTVKASAVAVHEASPGDERLVAYIIPENEARPVRTEEGQRLKKQLKQTLSNKLPAYMMPSTITILQEFPLNPNRKLDRSKLPCPSDWTRSGKSSHGEPSTQTERRLVTILSHALGLDGISLDDNFFDLGGHSLLAIQAINRISAELEVQIDLAQFGAAPTARNLARQIENPNAQRNIPLSKTSSEGKVGRASLQQQPLWRLERLYGSDSSLNVVNAFKIEGRLNSQFLQEGFQDLLARHENLRIRFVERNGVLYQEIPETQPAGLRIIDLKTAAPVERESIIEHCVKHEFSLSEGNLVQAALLEFGSDEHLLVVSTHHTVTDGWSTPIFFRDLSEIYNAKVEDREPVLPELTSSYQDFANWQHDQSKAGKYAESIQHWKDRLKDAPSLLDLPTDFPHPGVRSNPGRIYRRTLGRKQSEALKKLSKEHTCTPFNGLLSAFLILLNKYTGKEDIVINTPVANRLHAEVEDMVGLFTNIVPLRADLTNNPTLGEVIERSKEYSREALAHQSLPYETLIEELEPVRHPHRPPLAQVQFVLQNMPETKLELDGLAVISQPVSNGFSLFDLTLELTQLEDKGFQMAWEYRSDLFKEETIERLASHYSKILSTLCDSPGLGINQVQILSDEEKIQMMSTWNRTGCPYPESETIPSLFSRQAARNPGRTAAIFEDEHITYGELESRSNFLANRLLSFGAQPGRSCGLLLDRSIELVVGYLAILKTGAICLPIDPSFPGKRIALLLNDADASCVLSNSRLEALLPEDDCPCIHIDRFNWAAIRNHPSIPHYDGTPDSIAFLLYTSGSTGSPKGVQLAHRGIINSLSYLQSEWPLDENDKSILKASIGFDLSIAELLWPLLFGSSVILAKPGGHRDPAYLAQTIKEQGITHLSLTPSELRALLEEPVFSTAATLRAVVSCGEALTLDLLKQYYKTVDTPLFNLYGLSEDSIHTTSWRCAPQADKVLIGKPISNKRTYILDTQMNPVPVNVTGEIFVGGAGLALGYHNLHAQTAEAFIDSPFSLETGRLYRTGDLGRFCDDGNIEYIGRIDDQVQIRGLRIEPGEIESILQQHPGVQSAAVSALEFAPFDIRLTAWLELRAARSAPTEKDIRLFLREHLPDTFIPSAIEFVDRLPRNTNGKIDRKQLRASSNPAKAHEPMPDNSSAGEIAQIFSDVFGTRTFSPSDDFFDSGGHSLLAFRIANRLKAHFNLPIPQTVVFNFPTPIKLAAFIERLESQSK